MFWTALFEISFLLTSLFRFCAEFFESVEFVPDFEKNNLYLSEDYYIEFRIKSTEYVYNASASSKTALL